MKEEFEILKKIDCLKNIKKPRVTIIDVLRQKYNDENLISDWLAFIFDSNVNGIKYNKALKLLLSSIEREDVDIENEQCISVKREVCTSNQKRMDLLIECTDTVIVIENKIDSYENGNQTKEYWNYVNNEIFNKKNKIYIYLKPDYNESEPTEKEFVTLTYKRLINKLKEINEEDYGLEEIYKYKYLEEFFRIGEYYMKNEEFELNEEVNFYVEMFDKWNKLSQIYQNNNVNLINKLEKEIKNFFGGEKGYNFYKSSYYMQIYKPKWISEKYSIHYEVLLKNTTFANILGFEKVNIEVTLHIEGKIPEKIENQLNYIGIKNNTGRIRMEYDFKNNINGSIEKIISILKEIDKQVCGKIDNILDTNVL